MRDAPMYTSNTHSAAFSLIKAKFFSMEESEKREERVRVGTSPEELQNYSKLIFY